MASPMIRTEPAPGPAPVQPGAQPLPHSKVAFFGIFGIQNLGNECTLQAILHHARQRLGEGQLFAISFRPQDTQARHHLRAVAVIGKDYSRARPGRLAKVARILFRRLPGEVMDWRRAVRTLRGTRVLVMTGTGMLTDYSTTAFGYPYHVFRWALAARLAGCKVRFVGVGVGPIYGWLSRCFIRRALALADYRSFRDTFSRNRIGSIFDSRQDAVVPDLVFSLPASMFPARTPRAGGKLRVGLGIMDHRDVHQGTLAQQEEGYAAYMEKMCRFVEWLVGQGYPVRILQGDAKHDAAPRAELKARLEARGIRYATAGIVDEGSSSVAELLEQLAQVDIIVSPRFHNLLLGLMMNIPGISISYDPKNDYLLESVGLGEYCQSMENLDVDRLTGQFSSLVQRVSELLPQIARNNQRFRELLDVQYERIFAGCLSSGSDRA